MIGIIFNINFRTPLLNQTEQRTCLECFQTFSIEKCVPCLFVLNRYANRQHPYRWLLSRYHYTHVCLEIFIIYIYIYIYIKRELQSACSILAFKRSLFVLILHNQTLIKVCETKGVKYFTFRNKTLNIIKWRLKQLLFRSRFFFRKSGIFYQNLFCTVPTYTVCFHRQLLRSSRSR